MVYLTSLGWLMALPIAAGVLLGRFLDNRLATGNFWTLALLGVGISIAGIEAYLAIRRALQQQNHGS
jgi:ATP synthase protein I